ncbi:MAG: Rho termination factor N-terminal domain-containing protein [Desulfobacterales bacterium]|nr:Rho termination factor N-terminal domain-containing protein [Desulfobacterales bacterium]
MGKVVETNEKPLDKMTAIELREIAKQIPGVTGTSGMKKDELLSVVKKDRGIKEKKEKRAAPSIKEMKLKIKKLKKDRVKFLEEDNSKMAAICRRQVNRLKKKTRRAV